MKIVIKESQMRMVIESSNKPTRKSDILYKLWDKEKSEKGYATYDEDILEYFGIYNRDILDYRDLFIDYIGGEEEIIEFIDGLMMRTFSTEDFPKEMVGTYEFDWRISDFKVEDGQYNIECQVSEGGFVTLPDGRYLSLRDACDYDKNKDSFLEIEDEINDVIEYCMNSIIFPRTAVDVYVNYVEI
jgi:hypothetical protein